ncbi:uncharacterized protein [Medicago truncatula]|uniref:uncharacterized protein n=1 Tax=Medicago truncatula TaxID=3880 RepID=UPI0000D5D4D2|nr:uncharacterized protein LOC112420830 [Medicago truncatula]
MELVDETGIRRSVSGFGHSYEMMIKEFIVYIPKDCDSPLNKEYRKVFVRGKCVDFSPIVINRFLGRSEDEYTEVEVTDNTVCKEITSGQVTQWHIKGKLVSSKLNVKYALLHRIGAANCVSTNHTSTIATGLGKFIYIVGTKGKFNFGAYVYEQTLKHAQTFSIKMPISFPSIICGVILNQHPCILVSTDVVRKRKSPISLHPKLFTDTHVTDIAVTSEQEAAISTSKEGILAELQEMSKTLEETIKSSVERKLHVYNLIQSIITKEHVEEMAELNNDAIGNKDEEAPGNTEDGSTNEELEILMMKMEMMIRRMNLKLRLDFFFHLISIMYFLFFYGLCPGFI